MDRMNASPLVGPANAEIVRMRSGMLAAILLDGPQAGAIFAVDTRRRVGDRILASYHPADQFARIEERDTLT